MSVIAVSVMGCLFFYAMLGIKEKRRNWNNTPVIIYSYIFEYEPKIAPLALMRGADS